MEHKLFSFFSLLLILGLWLPKVCLGQYYGGQEENGSGLIVDKKIRSVDWSEYRDNVDVSNRVFAEGDGLEFKITVQNNGFVDLKNVVVTDMLPKYLCLVFSPAKLENGSLTWMIDKLEAGESRSYLIRARVCGTSKNLANEKLTNQVEVKTEELNDKDFASYFVGKRTTPSTGSVVMVWQSLAVLMTISGAWVGRKVARGY